MKSSMGFLGLAVSGLTILLGACSDPDGDDTGTTEPGEIPENMTNACTGAELRLAAGFTPQPVVDFIGFRTESTQPRPKTGDAGVNTTEAAWIATLDNDVSGVACSSASDRAACEKKLADLRLLGDQCQGIPIVPKDAAGAAAPSEPGYCSLAYLVYTRGDEVGTVRSVSEAIAFFAGIDSPQEAMYLLRLSGEALICGGASPAAYAKKDDGYDVQTGAGTRCGQSSNRRLVHVSKAGEIKVVSSEPVSSERCTSSH